MNDPRNSTLTSLIISVTFIISLLLVFKEDRETKLTGQAQASYV